MTDLPRDAFRVDDNGVRQTLSIFSNDTQPITAVVMLDRSGSMSGEFELVEKAAEAFVDDLGPADKAASERPPYAGQSHQPNPPYQPHQPYRSGFRAT